MPEAKINSTRNVTLHQLDGLEKLQRQRQRYISDMAAEPGRVLLNNYRIKSRDSCLPPIFATRFAHPSARQTVWITTFHDAQRSGMALS